MSGSACCNTSCCNNLILPVISNSIVLTLVCVVIIGYTSIPHKHPFAQSHPQKRQREGGCRLQRCPFEPQKRQWGQHRYICTQRVRQRGWSPVLTSWLFPLLGRPTESTGSTAMNKSSTLGSFYHLPPYLKLYDVLKATHANFKVWVHLCFKLLSASDKRHLFKVGNKGGSSLGDARPPQQPGKVWQLPACCSGCSLSASWVGHTKWHQQGQGVGWATPCISLLYV